MFSSITSFFSFSCSSFFSVFPVSFTISLINKEQELSAVTTEMNQKLYFLS